MASLLACGPDVFAQENTMEAKIDIKRLMLVDGPYELDGSTGVFGFVVARSAGKATFRPCTGPMFDVDDNKLKPTKSTCKDEAPDDGNSFSVGCGGGINVPSQVMTAIGKNASNGTAGTFFEMGSSSEVKVYATYDDDVASKIKSIDRMASCGNWNIGYDSKGTDLMHFLSTDDAKSGTYGDVKQ
ncbi:hypothetical protein HA464_06775 [Rhizobium leguminosarum bv. trifolii]|nr:hypothetical protein HA464_06775 [Rhizobium leguminosarum bv. trifolii]